MKVLVINCGSSSIKYQLFAMGGCSVIAAGVVERIGEADSRLIHRRPADSGRFDETVHAQSILDHRDGLQHIAAALRESDALRDPSELFGIGHRVVHGGEAFQRPILISSKVVEGLREMVPLAPLHNPANLLGIEVSLELVPDVPQVAVFDTAFHQSMPPHAFHYALPHELYTAHHVRRYGFHGTSHYYVAKQAASHLGKPLEALNLITLHLGNGASAAAIRAGKSIDTSMGMTPLEGLIMGTRCGDIDPAIHFFLARTTGKSNDELESLLNTESGLKGICGKNDMREVMSLSDSGDDRARLAVEMYCYRIKKYIGAYFAVLGRVDAIVFTGGIGENAALIRQRACEGLAALGIIIDERRNKMPVREAREIQRNDSAVSILVIPTDEELEIATQTVACIQAEREPG